MVLRMKLQKCRPRCLATGLRQASLAIANAWLGALRLVTLSEPTVSREGWFRCVRCPQQNHNVSFAKMFFSECTRPSKTYIHKKSGELIFGSLHHSCNPQLNAHSSTPTPVFLSSREETQTMVQENSDQNPDNPRPCIYQGKAKLRPWSEFLGRENSDHGLSFLCFWGRGRRGISRQRAKKLHLEKAGTLCVIHGVGHYKNKIGANNFGVIT